MIPAVMPTYARADVQFVEGNGSWMIDDRGRRFLDFGAGIAVTSVGHCHPHIVAALKEQGEKLWHTSNLFRIPSQEKLAQTLVDNSFADTVFFCNSGVEAWEAGVKAARRYHYVNGRPERWRIVTVNGCFHGRTLSAIAAAKSEKLTKGFGPLPDGFDQVAFANMNELRMAITDETAALHVEPIQGEGGIRPLPEGFLKDLRALCDEYGLLLFLDEIQSGNGRTGKLYAHEWEGIAPDLLCTAKGLGGGFPIGALLATEAAAAGMTAGTHGTTYGGNPLACAVAQATLEVMLADGFLDQVVARGAQLMTGLDRLVARYPSVFSGARGAGLMAGLICVPPNGDIVAALREEEQMIVVPAGDNVIRLLPALTVSEAEVEDALDRLARVADRLSASPRTGTDG